MIQPVTCQQHCCEDPARARSSGPLLHHLFHTSWSSIRNGRSRAASAGRMGNQRPINSQRTPGTTEMDAPLFDLNYGLPDLQLKLEIPVESYMRIVMARSPARAICCSV